MFLSLDQIYNKLLSCFGRQYWWPADTYFEVMVGAILTQNTNWSNVEKAILNLKKHKVLSAYKLMHLSQNKLASLIKPVGFYNLKAKRLKAFLSYLFSYYQGDISKMKQKATASLRIELLSVNGIGKETADSILLYALKKPVFVVDAYTKRILTRHGLVSFDAEYTEVQEKFMRNLKPGVKLFNEYHALLVRLGKEFCLKNKPRCKICPLKKSIGL